MEIVSKSLKEDDIITTRTTDYNSQFNHHDIINHDDAACPICNSTERTMDSRRAEVICAKCGCVLDENIIDQGAEWRAYDSEQRAKRARAGAPLIYGIADKGLPTEICYKNKDSNGRIIPERNRAQLYRLRKWNKRLRVSNASERNLAFALSELDRESSRLSIPRSVREDASFIYRQAAREKLIRGRSIVSMVAASLYMACRRNNIPRTLDEIAQSSKVSKKQLGKNYRFLSRKLSIKLPPTSPVDYVPRFASQLDLPGEVESKAIEIINKARDNGLLNGKGPTGIAATALYIASILLGNRRTQSNVADIAGVTEVTIRNRSKEFTENIVGI